MIDRPDYDVVIDVLEKHKETYDKNCRITKIRNNKN